MANTHATLSALFSDIADAIRAKTGSSATIKADEFPTAIAAISTGPDLSNDTATAADVRTGKTFHTSTGAATGTMANGSATTPATTISSAPTISVSSAGLITASNSKTQNVTPTVSAGYISAGTAGTITVSGSNTKQLTTKAAATITPGTSDQTIASGTYLTGAQTIKGDANLVAANIAEGVTIFGVEGAHSGSQIEVFTSAATIGTSNQTTIQFQTNGTPKGFRFCLCPIKNLTFAPASIYVMSGTYDASSGAIRVWCEKFTQYGSYIITAQMLYDTSNYTVSITGSGTSTYVRITSPSSNVGLFVANTQYQMTYWIER